MVNNRGRIYQIGFAISYTMPAPLIETLRKQNKAKTVSYEHIYYLDGGELAVAVAELVQFPTHPVMELRVRTCIVATDPSVMELVVNW